MKITQAKVRKENPYMKKKKIKMDNLNKQRKTNKGKIIEKTNKEK